MVVILWLALGLKLSWRKGCRGRHVEWIGVAIQSWCSCSKVQGVTFTMSPEKSARLAAMCEATVTSPTVPRVKLRQLAGLATWIAGVLPQFSAYTAMLWAALACAKGNQVDRRHVKRPIEWLLRFCRDGFTNVQRHCRRHAEYFTVVTFDGPLTGGRSHLSNRRAAL